MSKPVVFVIGASGKVGSSTIRALSSKYAETVEIKAGVRNPEKAETLKSVAQVTVVKACMGDEGLVETFAGVDKLFIVTPSTVNRASLANSTADAAKKAGVKHIFVVSVPLVDPKMVFGKQFSEIEQHISGLGIPYTIVRLPFFLEFHFTFTRYMTSQNTIYYCVDPDIPMGSVAAEDIGNAVADMLVNSSPYVNLTLTLFSDFPSYNDMVKEFSSAFGKEISYVQVPMEATEKKLTELGMQELQVKGLMEMFALVNVRHPTYVEGDTSVYEKITGKSPTSLTAWVIKNSSMFK